MYVQRNHDLIILTLRDMEYIGRAFRLVALVCHRSEYGLSFLDKFYSVFIARVTHIQVLFNYFGCLFCVFPIIARIHKNIKYAKEQLTQRADVRKAD